MVNYLNHYPSTALMKRSSFNNRLLIVGALISCIVILALICLNVVSAATISGSIYDLTLQKESSSIVEINTVPNQLIVSKTGDYSFKVKPGNYILYAHTTSSLAKESIIINDDGEYTLDIILEEQLTSIPKDLPITDSDINVSTSIPQEYIYSMNGIGLWMIIGIILTLSILIAILYLLISSRKHKSVKADAAIESAQLDSYEHKVLQLVKKDKRVTQKDLRKELPLSEAKISLIISDLEDKGKVRKIKKGRGNILIFIKD